MFIQVACLDRNPHELLVHDVAQRTGAYQRFGVDVAVVDAPGGSGLTSALSFGLGGTLLQRAREGVPWTVLAVNTDRPLFWLVARPQKHLNELRGGRIIGWPSGAVPTLMLRAALEDDGLDLDDIDVQPVPPGPGADARRLEALMSNEADAALLGSQLPPGLFASPAMTLLWLGDRIRIPTTGIAVNADVLSPHDPMLGAMVEAQREALRTIAEDEEVVLASLASLIEQGDREDHREFWLRYIRPTFGQASSDDFAVWAATAERLCRYAAVPPPDLRDFYGVAMR